MRKRSAVRSPPAKASPATSRLRLRLYVAGGAPNSLAATANLTVLLDTHYAGAYTLEVVDVLTSPEKAVRDGVLVTPTLMKLAPNPIQRLVGNLSDSARLLLLLGRP